MAYPPLLSDMRWSAEWPDLTVRSHWTCASVIWWRFPASQVCLVPLKVTEIKWLFVAGRGCIEDACDPAISAWRASLTFLLHETRLHSCQSGARRRGNRRDQNLRRGEPAFCALGAVAGAQRQRGCAAGPRRVHREIFRDRSRSSRSRLCGGNFRLARTGTVGSCALRPSQGLCAEFFELHHRSRSRNGAGGSARLSAADICARSFDGCGDRHSRQL